MKSFLQVALQKDELSYDDLTNDLCPVSVYIYLEFELCLNLLYMRKKMGRFSLFSVFCVESKLSFLTTLCKRCTLAYYIILIMSPCLISLDEISYMHKDILYFIKYNIGLICFLVPENMVNFDFSLSTFFY